MRILAGDVPPLFYLELILRTFFIYILIVFSMRLMGKRMSTQVSRLDLVAMVSLASAVGVPILAPDRGLVPAVLICLIIVGFSRIISRISTGNQRFETATQGDADILVEDAVLRFSIMRRIRITRERVFAHLRSESLTHLGSIRRMYMEADGNFTIIKNDTERPGLCVLPERDTAFIGKKVEATPYIVCGNCGIPRDGHAAQKNGRSQCSNCGAKEWTHAVKERR